ncbi:ROK family transcriptional regulator [Seohaeicola saemankumensis]|nr:ROK family transcriptional regulator [Seohaeicola saemankumensis]MCA0869398.1 ROK family transcriptional regulator [Seohaeicola saemankumensis]
MRAHNERAVLSLIRQNGAMAKADIARRTGLSAQTVSVIMRGLEADGMLTRGTPVRGKIGQPSVPMSLAADGAFFLGLQVDRRNLQLVLTDFLGHVRQQLRVGHPYPTPDGTVAFALDAIARIKSDLPVEHRSRIAGMGIALPFQLWSWAEALGVEDADIADWKERDIAAEIGAAADIPVFMCNDASAACAAELVFGDQDKPSDFLYAFVGYFVGGGLVLDKALFTGPSGNAAALGSMRVPNPDGQPRQLVDVASLATLDRALSTAGHDPLTWDSPENWDLPPQILERWLEEASKGMADAIMLSACMIDVQQVLIDGWMPAQMRAELVRRVKYHLSGDPLAGVAAPDVREGAIGPDARALGAASLPLCERFLINHSSIQKGPSR